MAVVGELNGEPIYLYQVLNTNKARAFPGPDRDKRIEQAVKGVVHDQMMVKMMESALGSKKQMQVRESVGTKIKEEYQAGITPKAWIHFPNSQAMLDYHYEQLLGTKFVMHVYRANKPQIDAGMQKAREAALAREQDAEQAARRAKSELFDEVIRDVRRRLSEQFMKDMQLTPMALMVARVDKLAP